MQKHLDVLGLLYLLAGLLSALVAVAVFVLGLGALSLAWSDEPQVAALFTGAAFLIIALLLGLWAGANAWVGRRLRAGDRTLGRLAAFPLAILHLFVLPFGTALGVYGLWVLVHPEAAPTHHR
jgi:hypothetical protein